jgi:hypothetical protein
VGEISAHAPHKLKLKRPGEMLMSGKKKDGAKRPRTQIRKIDAGKIDTLLSENFLNASVFARYAAFAERLEDFLAAEDSGFAIYSEKLRAAEAESRTLIELFVARKAKDEAYKKALKGDRRTLVGDKKKSLLNEANLLDMEHRTLKARIAELTEKNNALINEAIEHDNKKEAISKEENEVTTQLVAQLGEMYKSEGNPNYVWLAISLSDQAALHPPVPDWCLGYIVGCATGVRRFAGEDRTPGAGEMMEVFRFTSAGWNASTTAKTSVKHHNISSLVKAIGAIGFNKNKSIDIAAEALGMGHRGLWKIDARTRNWTDESKENDCPNLPLG